MPSFFFYTKDREIERRKCKESKAYEAGNDKSNEDLSIRISNNTK